MRTGGKLPTVIIYFLQDFRPDHVGGSLEDRICPQALADCRAYHDEAITSAQAEILRIKSSLDALHHCAVTVLQRNYIWEKTGRGNDLEWIRDVLAGLVLLRWIRNKSCRVSSQGDPVSRRLWSFWSLHEAPEWKGCFQNTFTMLYLWGSKHQQPWQDQAKQGLGSNQPVDWLAFCLCSLNCVTDNNMELATDCQLCIAGLPDSIWLCVGLWTPQGKWWWSWFENGCGRINLHRSQCYWNLWCSFCIDVLWYLWWCLWIWLDWLPVAQTCSSGTNCGLLGNSDHMDVRAEGITWSNLDVITVYTFICELTVNC